MLELAHTGEWTQCYLQERPSYAGHLERMDTAFNTRNEAWHVDDDTVEGIALFSTSNPTAFDFQNPSFGPWTLNSCIDNSGESAGLNVDETSIDLAPLCEQLNNLGRKGNSRQLRGGI